MSLVTYMYGSEHVLDRVVARMERFIKAAPGTVYLLFSGGKDSALLLLALSHLPEALQNKVAVIYNRLAGNTHPLNYVQSLNLLRELAPNHYQNMKTVVARRRGLVRVECFRAGKPPYALDIEAYNHATLEDFMTSLKRYGIPYPAERGNPGRSPLKKRWCMMFFKTKWWEELPPVGSKRYLIVGVKRTDSRWRAKKWAHVDPELPVHEFNTPNAVDVALAPLVDLTSAEVSEVLRDYGIKLKTYEEYGDSLNCVFCPLRPRDKVEKVIRSMPREWLEQLHDALRSQRVKTEYNQSVLDRWLPAIEEVLNDA